MYSLSILYGLIVSAPLLTIFIVTNLGENLFDQWNKPGHLIRFIVWMVALIVIHELIHGIFFSMFSKNRFKDVRFGFNVSSFVPYCSCKEPLKKAQYMIASFMPCLLLGIIPGIVGIVTPNLFLFVIGIIMI